MTDRGNGSEPASAFGTQPADRADRAGVTILLVDDEPLVRNPVAESLRNAGYRVLEAASGKEALNVAQGGAPINLVVTDVVMPGLTGPDLVKQLAARQRGFKVLFVSGYTRRPDDLVDTAEDAPPHDFLQKPFSLKDLLRKVDEVLSAA